MEYSIAINGRLEGDELLLDLFLLELTGYYSGNPYYVTGNALAHAARLGKTMTDEQKKTLSVSHGIFRTVITSGMANYGTAPATYKDFFDAWRTVQNTLVELVVPELRYCAPSQEGNAFVLMAPTRVLGKKKVDRDQGEVPTYLSFYATGLNGLDPNIFDGIQVGGKRNNGMGLTKLHRHIQVDTSTWKLDTIGELGIELITPLCTESTFPGCNSVELPEFLETHNFRTREERLNIHGKSFQMQLIDHGQAFKLKSGLTANNIEKIIMNGIERIGNHNKYGYGEYKVFEFKRGKEKEKSL